MSSDRVRDPVGLVARLTPGLDGTTLDLSTLTPESLTQAVADATR